MGGFGGNFLVVIRYRYLVRSNEDNLSLKEE